MVFGSRRGRMDLFVTSLGASPNSEQVLLSTPAVKFPTDWSSDGQFVLYNQLSPRGDPDIRALSMEGSPAEIDVVATEHDEQHAQFSPDGRWIAYQSNRTGRFEIFVRPFPGPGRDIPVSTNGGTQARWHPKGQELFYIAADDRLMAVPMRRGQTGSALEPGAPQPLFLTNVGSTAPNMNRHQYMVSPDGDTFVLNARPEQPVAPPIKVILNWQP
jgi:dipeptidyl aminopeptidase/acylaminoacyl peptidase